MIVSVITHEQFLELSLARNLFKNEFVCYGLYWIYTYIYVDK